MAISSRRSPDREAPFRAAGTSHRGRSRGPSEGIKAWATFLLDVHARFTDTRLRRHAAGQTLTRVRHRFVVPICMMALTFSLGGLDRLAAMLG
jgi:hypothetical protein